MTDNLETMSTMDLNGFIGNKKARDDWIRLNNVRLEPIQRTEDWFRHLVITRDKKWLTTSQHYDVNPLQNE